MGTFLSSIPVEVTAAVLGLLSGAVGSRVAPWVNWGVEVRRSRRAARQDVIRYARHEIRSGDFGLREFEDRDIFHQLKPHMRPGVLRAPADQGPDGARALLLEEVARIERVWKLV